MADEITWSVIALALGGAFIGAGGAILAQLIAGLLAGRRDSQRLNWEKASALREERRDVFVTFLLLIALRFDLYTAAAVYLGEERAAAETKLDSTEVQWQDDYTAKSIEVKLVAPELSEYVESVSALFAEWSGETWSDGPPTGEYYNMLAERYRVLRKEGESLMQVSLGFATKP